VNIRRRDWFAIFRDLMAAGVSMNAIARKCNRDPGAVKHWANGGDPKDSDARVILHLYARHCPAKYKAHAREFDVSPEADEPQTRVGRFLRLLNAELT
jgi:hypothetical protein